MVRLAAMAIFFWSAAMSVEALVATSWVVDYSEVIDLERLKRYDLIILDSSAGLERKVLFEEGKKILGYLSLGQLSDKRDYFSIAKREGLLLEEDPNWKGSYLVDIRKRKWCSMVIEKIIPQILFKRFQGLMLDTVDQISALEVKDPKRYGGMREAAVRLVKAIRYHYPNIILMMNRGYDILPEVASYLNISLGESVYTTYNFTTKKYERVKPSDYEWQVNKLKEAKAINPDIELFTLDYWYPEDKKTIAEIYRTERKNGFIPYVSTVDLQQVIDEP